MDATKIHNIKELKKGDIIEVTKEDYSDPLLGVLLSEWCVGQQWVQVRFFKRPGGGAEPPTLVWDIWWATVLIRLYLPLECIIDNWDKRTTRNWTIPFGMRLGGIKTK